MSLPTPWNHKDKPRVLVPAPTGPNPMLSLACPHPQGDSWCPGVGLHWCHWLLAPGCWVGCTLAASPFMIDHRDISLPFQGPVTGRFKKVIAGILSSGRYPMLVKLPLWFLFDYLSILYCLLFSLQGNFVSIKFKLFSTPSLVLKSLFKVVNTHAQPCFPTDCIHIRNWDIYSLTLQVRWSFKVPSNL